MQQRQQRIRPHAEVRLAEGRVRDEAIPSCRVVHCHFRDDHADICLINSTSSFFFCGSEASSITSDGDAAAGGDVAGAVTVNSHSRVVEEHVESPME